MLSKYVDEEFHSPLCKGLVSQTGVARLSAEDLLHRPPRLSGYALIPPVILSQRHLTLSVRRHTKDVGAARERWLVITALIC
jgi:hypothetical protein